MEKPLILNNISQESIEEMIPCFKPFTKLFRQNEIITNYNKDSKKRIGVILEGKAQSEIYNDEGDAFLLENLEKNDIFGELFTLPLNNFQYVITATTDCLVLYLDYEHVIRPCENACFHHSTLISNLFLLTSQKAQELSLHVSILKQHTIRDKLLTYLQVQQSSSGGSETFVIPMSLSKLADYLGVDRSSMMRELRSMKKDGIILSNRQEFTLLDNNKYKDA